MSVYKRVKCNKMLNLPLPPPPMLFDLLVCCAADREKPSEMDRPHLSLGQAVKHPFRFAIWRNETVLSTV